MHIQLQDLLVEMQAQIDEDRLDLQLLVRLVDRLRPSDAEDQGEINKRIKAFIRALIMTPTAPDIVQRYVLRLLNQYKQVSLYVESGILGSEGFNTQLSQRIGAHFLPLVKDESELKDLVGKVFYKKVTAIGSIIFKQKIGNRFFAYSASPIPIKAISIAFV